MIQLTPEQVYDALTPDERVEAANAPEMSAALARKLHEGGFSTVAATFRNGDSPGHAFSLPNEYREYIADRDGLDE